MDGFETGDGNQKDCILWYKKKQEHVIPVFPAVGTTRFELVTLCL